MAQPKLIIWGGLVLALGFTVATVPFWGMGAAVFLDSDRAVLSRALSPNGKRVAQVERLIVGGAPSIVVTIKPAWMPDWHVLGCAAASHYGEIDASLRWQSNQALKVITSGAPRFCSEDGAPFHRTGCNDLATTITS